MLLDVFAGVALLVAGAVHAQPPALSIYPIPSASPATPSQAPGGVYIGYPSYDPTMLDPPTGLNNPNTQFAIQLTAAPPQNLGPKTAGSLFGFSIEMSIADAVIGKNGKSVGPELLNLLSLLKARGGAPVLRLGGNTQEKAALVQSLPNGATIKKFSIGPTGPTNTPTVLFTTDMLEAMKTVSDSVGVKWYMGLAFNQSRPARLDIVDAAWSILGDNVIGWQLGNEPDLYAFHNLRNTTYDQQDYIAEVADYIQQYNADTNFPTKKNLGGPSLDVFWPIEQMLNDFGYISNFSQSLNTIMIEQYPHNNCNDTPYVPSDMLLNYTKHSAVTSFIGQFDPVVQTANAANLPVILIETNTASCSGFVGISDAFVSALWAVDLALQTGLIGIQHVMMHMGGQGVYYNPFIPPPFNASSPFMWTVGPIFYSAVMVAEALGPSNTSQIVDLGPNNGQDQTPAYAIYETTSAGVVPVRVVLINYITDPTGAQNYTANISIDSGTPQNVSVRYLAAGSVTYKTANITYGGRSFGGPFGADGLLHGTDEIVSVQCANNVCPIMVPAPGAALVFLTDAALAESVPQDPSVQTFTSTFTTGVRRNTATIPQAVLATSNGISGFQRKTLASSSAGTAANAAEHLAKAPVLSATAVLVLASILLSI